MNPIRLRAVLSWNAPPSSTHPYAQAVWGNSLDRRMMISSLSEVKSGKESAVQSGHLRNHSALAFNAEDLEDRGPSSAQFRWNPAELIRDATSC
jgi:predicted NACHT family NTPase